MAWTDKRIEQLKKYWEKGLTASQIAEKLGEVTRNAVIGKAHRLGLSGRPSPLKTSPETRAAPPPPKAQPQPKQKITLLMITDRMCKWPIGHPGEPDFQFCGESSTPGQPYCASHAAIAYQERPSKRDRRDRPPPIRS